MSFNLQDAARQSEANSGLCGTGDQVYGMAATSVEWTSNQVGVVTYIRA